MNASLLRLSVCLFLFASTPLLAFGQVTGSFGVPASGDDATYYDIDMDGRILKIDYLAQTAEVLGKLDLESSGIPPLWSEWLIGQDPPLHAFLVDILGGAHLYTFETNSVEPVAKDLQLGEEYTVLPVPGDKILISKHFFDASDENMIYDPAKNEIVGTFDFRLHPQHRVFPQVQENLFILVMLPRTYAHVVERGSYELIDTVNIMNMFPSHPISFSKYFEGFADAFVIAGVSDWKSQVRDVFLVDIVQKAVVASSATQSKFSGKWLLDTDEDGSRKLLCIEQKPANGLRVDTGDVRVFLWEGSILKPLPSIHFNADTQIVLKKPGGGFIISTKYIFDYVSQFQYAQKFILSLHRTKPAYKEIALELMKEGKIRRDLAEELRERESHANFKRLQIVDRSKRTEPRRRQ